MNSKPTIAEVPLDQPVDEVTRWHQQEDRNLRDKLNAAKSKPPVIEAKIDVWRELDAIQRRKKCVSTLKSKFKKPYNLLIKLQDIGTDVISAVEEGVKPYRVERIITAYSKQRLKLMDAVKEAENLNDSLPEASASAGNFIWQQELPDVIDEDNVLYVLTKDGIRRAQIERED